jgi:hypothetical protein
MGSNECVALVFKKSKDHASPIEGCGIAVDGNAIHACQQSVAEASFNRICTSL